MLCVCAAWHALQDQAHLRWVPGVGRGWVREVGAKHGGMVRAGDVAGGCGRVRDRRLSVLVSVCCGGLRRHPRAPPGRSAASETDPCSVVARGASSVGLPPRPARRRARPVSAVGVWGVLLDGVQGSCQRASSQRSRASGGKPLPEARPVVNVAAAGAVAGAAQQGGGGGVVRAVSLAGGLHHRPGAGGGRVTVTLQRLGCGPFSHPPLATVHGHEEPTAGVVCGLWMPM